MTDSKHKFIDKWCFREEYDKWLNQMQQTKKTITYLIWSILSIFLSVCVCVVFCRFLWKKTETLPKFVFFISLKFGLKTFPKISMIIHSTTSSLISVWRHYWAVSTQFLLCSLSTCSMFKRIYSYKFMCVFFLSECSLNKAEKKLLTTLDSN